MDIVSTNQQILDNQVRQEALDPSRSFIVQAPAGSGKTELLTQRFLSLLAHVQKAPEEIIAITFTRKAAAEMRARILAGLSKADTPSALAARARDHKERWQLLDNPNRLRIMTIDALCASLARQMPVLAKFGTQFNIADNANDLYIQAVQHLLMILNEKHPWSAALSTVLLHVDNDINRLTNLLVTMLANREQWLSHILGMDTMHELEETLGRISKEIIGKCHAAVPKELGEELAQLTNFAAYHVKSSPLRNCRHLENIPEPTLENQPLWLGIAYLLLTKTGEWRKKFTATQGFPAPSTAKNKSDKQVFKDNKTRMEILIDKLSSEKVLQECLQELIQAPPVQYTKEQTSFIKALATLLPVLVAQLQLIFAQHNKVDYIEVATRALQALADADNPTQLALALDYQITHILVDEFQDTSLMQLRLIERLTSGWQQGDGRTLFCVGDPMQSIYRFRKAEVGIFLQAQQHGIGQIRLENLTLTSNFRATPNIVNWLNQTFQNIFPKSADLNLGAITYSSSQALPQSETEQAVHYHYFSDASDNSEATMIINILKETWKKMPQARIAVLVRARQHLQELLSALHKAGIAYRGVDIASLKDEPVIQDLLALTRALLHPADRIAWLAILRAPWCGLTLSELYSLTSKSTSHSQQQLCIWDDLKKTDKSVLSEASRQRLELFMHILERQLNNRQRGRLSQWVKQTWIALQGPTCLSAKNQLLNANAYFQLLDNLEINGDIADFELLEQQLQQLSATPAAENEVKLEIMTIHKSKGLEFDVVILPGLHRATRADSPKLFLWSERINENGKSNLIIGTLKSTSESHDAIYDYLRLEENKKSYYEMQRLLYVAATRAKRQLHILIAKRNDEGHSQSLLYQLWPAIKDDVDLKKINLSDHSEQVESKIIPKLKRMVISEGIFRKQNNIILSNEIIAAPLMQLNLDQLVHAAIGTVVHSVLQQMSFTGIEMWSMARIEQLIPQLRQQLLQLAVPQQRIPPSLTTVLTSLRHMIVDPRGQWILNRHHQDAHSELALTAIKNNEITRVIIDRTFVDDKDKRWIIDYKITNDVQIEPYQRQIENYANIMRLRESRPICLGLYFPLTKDWLAWEYASGSS